MKMHIHNFKKYIFKATISFISLFLIFTIPMKSLVNYEQKENFISNKQNVDVVPLSETPLSGNLSQELLVDDL